MSTVHVMKSQDDPNQQYLDESMEPRGLPNNVVAIIAKKLDAEDTRVEQNEIIKDAAAELKEAMSDLADKGEIDVGETFAVRHEDGVYEVVCNREYTISIKKAKVDVE